MTEIHRNMPASEYHAIPDRLSASGIQDILKTPAHYKAAISAREETPSMLLGTMVHALWLEPVTFDDRFAVKPEYDARTKEGKAIRDAFVAGSAGKSIVSSDGACGVETALAMRDTLKLHGTAGRVREAMAEIELSIIWQHNECPMKSRLDGITEKRLVVDLKTIRSADDASIERALMDGYAAQAATYLAAAEDAGLSPTGFVFVFVENSPPFGVRVVVPGIEAIAFGRKQLADASEIFRDCLAAGRWPAYPEDIKTLGLPSWKSRQLQYEE